MKKSKYIFVVLMASAMAQNPHHHLGLKHDTEKGVLLHHGIEQTPLVAQFLKELGIQHTYESKEVKALNEIIGRLSKIDSARIEREVASLGQKATISQHANLWAAEDSEKAMQQAWLLVQENIDHSAFLNQLLTDVSALTYINAKSITKQTSEEIMELARGLAIRAQEMKNVVLYHIAKASHMHAPEDKTSTSLQDAWSLLSGNVKKMKALLLQIYKNEEQLVKLHGGSIEDMQKSKLVTDHKYNGAQVWLSIGYDTPWKKSAEDVKSYQTNVINAANLPVAELKAANPAKEKMEKWNLTEHSNFADFHTKQEEILHEITALCVSSNNQNANRIPAFVNLLLSLKDNQNEGISAAAEVAYVEYMYALYSCLTSNRFLGQIDLVKEFGHNVRDARAHWRTLLSALNGDVGAQTSAQHTHAKKKAAHAKAHASAANGDVGVASEHESNLSNSSAAEPVVASHQSAQKQGGSSEDEDLAIAGGAGLVVGAAAAIEVEHVKDEHSAAPVAAPSAPAPAPAGGAAPSSVEEAAPAHQAHANSGKKEKDKKEKSDSHSKKDHKGSHAGAVEESGHHQEHSHEHAGAHSHEHTASHTASHTEATKKHDEHHASEGHGANPKKPSGTESSAGAAKRSPTPSNSVKQSKHASSSAKPKSSAKGGSSRGSASSGKPGSKKKKQSK